MNFTQEEIQQIEAHGLTQQQVEEQLSIFKNGVPKVKLAQAATVNNGIFKLTDEQEFKYIDLYEHHKENLDILKFTPASGAASRMFKKLYQFLDDYNPENETIEEFIARNNDEFLKRFFENKQEFPFYDKVMSHVNSHYSEEDLKTKNAKDYAFIKILMGTDAMDYGSYPKGLLPFHNYESYLATAFEEHLHEAAAYASKNNKAQLHFTVSPDHQDQFDKKFKSIHTSVSNTTDVNFKVSYSFQKPETDTVAVTLEDELYKKPDGTMLFRPGGHGALIENLNDVDADVIFIKNIDNVLVQAEIPALAHHKKVLAGLMLELQEKIFEYASKLDKGQLDEQEINELVEFLENDFSTRLDDDFNDFSQKEKETYLYNLLDRPIRVCGMVKNEGEPGGGPFWVTDKTGKTALQIIEGAQVDKDDEEQLQIFNNSTHFNPVDIVCGVRNFKGNKYDLTKYVNPDLAFIASKTDNGTPIKALELPGLWNGAMARWNTIFVEVPLTTFNPVKTVNDLLKPAHQVQ